MNLAPPKGTDDILPPDSRAWRRVLRSWDSWAERFGFELGMTPLFEATELFERGVGESTEVVRKQMYTFEDMAGRSLSLRPEGTASFIRAYLNAGIRGVWKATYSGPMFRYEKPQKGRRRQFFQVGAEIIGTDSPEADAEIIEFAYRFLLDLGVPAVVVEINSLGDPGDRSAHEVLLVDWLNQRIDQLCPDSVETLAINPLRVLDCKVCRDVTSAAPTSVESMGPAAREAYEAVKGRLALLGVPYRENPRLVRGLDYYTRTAFEYLATGLDAAQNAVGGGGRYDGLAAKIGGRAVSGVGVAMGIDRIILAMGEPLLPSTTEAFVIAAPEFSDEAATVVSRLREEGSKIETLFGSRSLNAQAKAAAKTGVPVIVTVDAGFTQGRVTYRDLRSGEETQVAIEELSQCLRP
jgi:histidyl-tRNA synthetase